MIVWIPMVVLGLWISRVDLKEYRIPDSLISLGLVLILLLCITGGLDVEKALVGMFLAVGQMLIVRTVTHQGLGLGDVKYAALLGAFLGPLWWCIAGFLSSLLAMASILPYRKHHDANHRLAFAPYLTAAAVFAGPVRSLVL